MLICWVSFCCAAFWWVSTVILLNVSLLNGILQTAILLYVILLKAILLSVILISVLLHCVIQPNDASRYCNFWPKNILSKELLFTTLETAIMYQCYCNMNCFNIVKQFFQLYKNVLKDDKNVQNITFLK